MNDESSLTQPAGAKWLFFGGVLCGIILLVVVCAVLAWTDDAEVDLRTALDRECNSWDTAEWTTDTWDDPVMTRTTRTYYICYRDERDPEATNR